MTMHWQMARRAERLNPSTIREILKITERPGIISLAGGLPSADTFPVQAMRDATLRDFKVTLLTPTLAHCTYICERRTPDRTEWSNRASLWDRASGRWQLRFHQGTPTNSAKST